MAPPTSPARRLLDHAVAGTASSLPDRELLARFLVGDHPAFAALLDRHGPMLRGCCRRWVADAHLADDVLQATFVVLARNAGSIRQRDSLAGWLYSVARRLARRAQMAEDARLRRERSAAQRPRDERGAEWAEMLQALDEELGRLPDPERTALMLCYLEGRTQDEAAAQLGLPLITLRRRLERGRERLRLRLMRRGLTLGAGLLAGAIAIEARVLSDELRRTVLTAALASANGAALAPTVAAIVGGSLRLTIGSKALLWSAALLACGALVGAGWFRAPARGTPAEPPAPKAPPVVEAKRDRFNDPLPAGAIARLGTIAFKHGGVIDRLNFAPDGKSVISSGDRVIRRWQVDTGHETDHFDFRDGGRETRNYILSSDGRTTIAIFGDPIRAGPHTVEIRNARTGELQREIQVPYSETFTVSPDGRRLSLRRSELEVWNLATAQVQYRVPAGSARFSADGRILVTCTQKQRIRVYDAATGELRREFGGEQSDLHGMILSHDGKWLVTLGRKLGEPKQFAPNLSSVAIINDKSLRVWDVDKGELTGTLEVGRCENGGYSFSPDGRTLLVVVSSELPKYRCSVQRWDIATRKLVASWPADMPYYSPVAAISPDGKTLATAAEGVCVQLWDLERGREVGSDTGHRSYVSSVVFARDGASLVTMGSGDNSWIEWNLATQTPTRHTYEPRTAGGMYSYSPDLRYRINVENDQGGRIRVWDLKAGGDARDFGPAPRPLSGFSTSADSEHFTVVSAEGKLHRLRTWQIKSGKLVHEIEIKALEQRFYWPWLLPDDRIVMTRGAEARLFDGKSGRELIRWSVSGDWKPEEDPLVGYFPSSDGRFIACALPGNRGIELRRTSSGALLRRLAADLGLNGRFPARVAFSNDGKRIAAAIDNTNPGIVVWDVASGKKLRELSGLHAQVTCFAFSPDGKRLASGSADCTALIWQID